MPQNEHSASAADSQKRGRAGITPLDERAHGRATRHAAAIAVALLLILIAYAGAREAGFVYDDNFEIVENNLIQDPHEFWNAMSRDVWAFKGERAEAWSNYWRPATVAFKSLCFQLFGLRPLGWHIVSVALHALATVLGYALLLRLGTPWVVSAIATWIFAAH